MKSPSKLEIKPDDVVNFTNEALDSSVEDLPKQVLVDIAKVRASALRANKHENEKFLAKFVYDPHLLKRIMTIAVPSAVAVVIALSVNQLSITPIPELPSALLSGDVPSEDLAMLENMEFVAWLAENETNSLL